MMHFTPGCQDGRSEAPGLDLNLLTFLVSPMAGLPCTAMKGLPWRSMLQCDGETNTQQSTLSKL